MEGKGWKNDGLRHSLARKGIKTTNLATKNDKVKEIAEAGRLTWKAFQQIYLDNAEQELQRLLDENLIVIEADEVDPTTRQQLRETRITFSDDGEEKELSVMPETEINFSE
jgi:hypothetical protein